MRSSALPWGMPSAMSNSTTSPSSLRPTRWASVPPIWPAPINAIFGRAMGKRPLGTLRMGGGGEPGGTAHSPFRCRGSSHSRRIKERPSSVSFLQPHVQVSGNSTQDLRVLEQTGELLDEAAQKHVLSPPDVKTIGPRKQLGVGRELIERLGIRLFVRSEITERHGLEPMQIGNPGRLVAGHRGDLQNRVAMAFDIGAAEIATSEQQHELEARLCN